MDLAQLNMSLAGRVALVTGGTRGIGAGIALALAKAGAEIVISGRDRAGGAEVVAAIRESGGTATHVVSDLEKEADVDSLIHGIVERHGKLDILVNNAAIDREVLALDYELDTWRRILRFNLEVPFRLSLDIARHLIARDAQGSIINISSVQGLIGAAEECAYAPAKHGLNGLTKTLAIEWAGKGIRVNAIAPGFIKTEMTRYMWEDPAVVERIHARYPVGRMGFPDDLGGLAVLLASDAASFIHGQIIAVDGGRLAG